jgi:aminoglycoside phosphotransferase (APT) family kinase protein
MLQTVNHVVLDSLRKLGLGSAQEVLGMAQLSGGVSSDIWRIDFQDHSICAKRALSKLKVAAHWEAPLSRNAYEYAWYQVISPLFPHNVPQMLGRDEEAGLFFMSYLEPEHHPVWKNQLLAKQIDPAFARSVGQSLGQIHRSTANSKVLAQRFPSDAEFFSLRLDPYLLATAKRHPQLQTLLQTICDQTANTPLVLVHGDISPKNILCGPNSPVFLDAECAWYGDPAFDLAFCLNHLLLKAVHMPEQAEVLANSFRQLKEAYMAMLDWESPAALEHRAARLLPALFLARVDGKSPVEYLTHEPQRQCVREIAQMCLLNSDPDLNLILETTVKALQP